MGSTIGELIDKIKIAEPSVFRAIKRFQYLPYDISYALKVVEAIGKERSSEFVIDNDNRFLFENLIRWVHGDSEFKCIDSETKQIIPGRLDAGIYVAGRTGTGKTWALEIMSAYCSVDDVKVFACGIQQDLRWPNIRTDVICDDYSATGLIQRYKNASIVGFQDFGAEQAESLFMGNRMRVMQQIIESRGDRKDLLTLITSNLPINHEKLIKQYDVRVASRLVEMCNYFELAGKDRRKK